MIFFNLKRLARLLAILLAILPVSELAAASPLVSVSTADSIVGTASNSSDATTILSAAGFPGGLQAALTGANVSTSASTAQTFTATLTYLFGTSLKKYGSSSNLNYSAIQGLYQTYNTQAQSILAAVSSKQAPTVSAVSYAMQSLVILIAACLNSFGYEFMKSATALSLPLTGKTIEPTGSVPSKDQYVVNLFIQELSTWIQYYVSAVTNSVNSITTSQLQAAAVQLGLTPASGTSMATAMQNVINASTDVGGNPCNAKASLQSQIACAFAWYQSQLNIIMANTNNSTVTNNLTANITPSIDPTTNSIFQIKPAGSGTPGVPNIAAAVTSLNTIDTNATNTIKGAVTTYGPKITAATDQATVNTNFNTALSLINATYPALIGSAGTITAQNNSVSDLEKAANAAITALTNACPSTPLTTANTAYTTAQSNFTTALQNANTDFPEDLPVSAGVGTLTATNASTYGTSVPGAQVEALATDQTNAINAINNTNNINSATTNAGALNSAVTAATKTFTNYTSGFSTTADITKAGGLATVITQVNTYYTQTIAAGSAYVTALASANNLLTQLQAIQSQSPQPTGLATAISTMQTAISAANTAFPQATPTIVFSAANSAAGQTYANSVPGIAITALNNIVNSGNAVTSATTNAGALNSAVTAAQGVFTNYTGAAATTTLVGTAAGLATAIAQVNTYYTQTIAAGSAYATALASAKTLLTQLQAMQSQNPQPTGLATAISTMQTAINNASNAFPQSTPTIVFSSANSTGAGQAVGSVTAAQMVASTPGQAIAALNAAANSTPNPGTNRAALAVSIAAALLVIVIGGVKAYNYWKSKQSTNPDENASDLENNIVESSITSDELQIMSDNLTADANNFSAAVDDNDTAGQDSASSSADSHAQELLSNQSNISDLTYSSYGNVEDVLNLRAGSTMEAGFLEGSNTLSSIRVNTRSLLSSLNGIEAKGGNVQDVVDSITAANTGNPMSDLANIQAKFANGTYTSSTTVQDMVSDLTNPDSGPTGGNTVVPKGSPEYEKIVEQAAATQKTANDVIKNMPEASQQQAIEDLRNSIITEMQDAAADSEAAAEAAGKAQQFNEDFPEDPIVDAA